MGGGVGGGEGEIVRVVAVQDTAVPGYDPQQVAVLDGIGVGESVEVADDRPEPVFFRIVLEEDGGIAHQQFPVPGLPDPVGVRPAGGGHVPEPAFGRQAGCPLRSRGPEDPGRTSENIVHLVVGEAERVVRAEILVVFVDAVPVEPAGSGDPDMPVGILGEGVHPLVGEAVGDDDGPGRVRDGRRTVSAARERSQQGEKGQKLIFHRVRFG